MKKILLLITAISSSMVSGSAGSAYLDAPSDVRERLTAGELFAGNLTELVHNGHFLPVGDVGSAPHSLSGTLHFSDARMNTIHPDSDWKGEGQTFFPPFSLAVLSHEGRLIPLERGIIYSGEKQGSFWNIIVSPGRVWRESTDGGYSRASFPFVLTDNKIGQARNGVATFVFNELEVSNAAIQITQETAPVDEYTRCDFFGVVPVRYERGQIAERDQLISDFERERAMKLPIHPWSELGESDLTRELYNEGLVASDVSAAALLIDGVLYMQPVETRVAGPHPYPENMRHGVFSVTKTLGLGLSMFYLAQRYGESIFDARITDHVPILADHPGWRGVTFANTLDMATGTQGRDEGFDIYYFIRARSAAAKIWAIRNLSDAPPAPGETFKYASTHSFVISYAMNQYVKDREGPDADYWLLLKEDILKPLGIEHLPIVRTIETEGELGTPIMGWGSYPNVDEAAKIGQLLQNEGTLDGRQVLNRNKVREALYRTWQQGYDAGGGNRYLHSVWGIPVQTSQCQVLVPTMAGHGANYVLMLPSGLTAIRFSDANRYIIDPMVRVAERYRSSCR